MRGTVADSLPTPVEMRTEDVPCCLVCGHEGSALYAGLRDRLFGSPGEWAFSRCPRCSFVWLNPRPCPQDLPKAYATYYTHSPQDTSRWDTFRRGVLLAVCGSLSGCEKLAPNRGSRLVGRALRVVPTVAETAKLMVRGLEGRRAGSLLDIGCGSGEYLSL